MKKYFLKSAKTTLILVYLVIIAGALVRMTGSGMGCPDWPKCFGYYIPPTDIKELTWTPNREFEEGPPFGGNKAEYTNLFSGAFTINKMEVCTNSVAPRANSELFIELEKNTAAEVHLYTFEGITCIGCKATVSEKLAEIDRVMNVNMNTNFTEVIIASEKEVALQKLQETVSYDEKYKIIKAN